MMRQNVLWRNCFIALIQAVEDLAAVTADLLSHEGLEARIAATGREALEAVADFKPQLVLCDLNLPDMSGLEALRALRARPSCCRATAVILTALRDSEIGVLRSRAAKAGIHRVLSKPLTVEDIRTLLPELKTGRR